jgi:hypothetical protein
MGQTQLVYKVGLGYNRFIGENFKGNKGVKVFFFFPPPFARFCFYFYYGVSIGINSG